MRFVRWIFPEIGFVRLAFLPFFVAFFAVKWLLCPLWLPVWIFVKIRRADRERKEREEARTRLRRAYAAAESARLEREREFAARRCRGEYVPDLDDRTILSCCGMAAEVHGRAIALRDSGFGGVSLAIALDAVQDRFGELTSAVFGTDLAAALTEDGGDFHNCLAVSALLLIAEYPSELRVDREGEHGPVIKGWYGSSCLGVFSRATKTAPELPFGRYKRSEFYDCYYVALNFRPDEASAVAEYRYQLERRLKQAREDYSFTSGKPALSGAFGPQLLWLTPRIFPTRSAEMIAGG